MNQTTTGCANCYYCSNGMCFYGARCYGTQAICINGTMITLPINDINLEEMTMNNEELKKKIVNIIVNIEWTDIFGIRHVGTADGLNNAIADALIAAGIGDVKDLQAQVNVLEITNIALQAGYDDAEKDRLYWVDKYKEAEHRAEVAEQKYKLLFQKYDSFFNDVTYCHKNFSDVDSEITKQAEKKLAEERK